MQTLLIVVGLLGGLLGTIYTLYNKYKQALDKLAQYETQEKVKDNLQKIEEEVKNVQTTQDNFDDLVKQFRDEHPDKG